MISTLPPLVVLAAGLSGRMGVPKGLVPCAGATWLEHTLKGFARAGGGRVVVVLGAHCGQYCDRLPWLREACAGQGTFAGLRVEGVENPVPGRGQFSSLQCGLARIRLGGETACLVLPVDTPSPRPSTWIALALRGGGPGWVKVPVYAGRQGHPVWLAEPFLSFLATLDPGDPASRLDRQIAALAADRVLRIDVDDPAVALNINTPADFAACDRSGTLFF